MTGPVRVAIVDDQALIRSGVRLLLESADDLEVVGEAADGRGALELVAAAHPDVVLMDLRMPVLDGLEATRLLRQDPQLRTTKVVVLTTFEHDELVFAALRAGASGFLLKDTEPDELRRAVRAAAAGEAALSPSVTRTLIEGFTRDPPPPDGASTRLAVLTDREREILTLVGRGLRNDTIADQLVISPETVRTHVGRAMTKLEVTDRAGLVVVAYETGLVRPGDDRG